MCLNKQLMATQPQRACICQTVSPFLAQSKASLRSKSFNKLLILGLYDHHIEISLGGIKGMSNHAAVGKEWLSHKFQRNFISPKESWLTTQGKKKGDLLKGDRPLYSIGLLYNLKNKKYLDNCYKTLRLQIFLDTQSYHVKVAWRQFAFFETGIYSLSQQSTCLSLPSTRTECVPPYRADMTYYLGFSWVL